MKHLKRFNEMFDTEDLKSEFEIKMLKDPNYMKKVVKNTLSKGWINPQKLKDDIKRLHEKISRIYPFFDIIKDEEYSDNVGLDEMELNTYGYWFRNKHDVVMFIIHIRGFNDYEVSINHFNSETKTVIEFVEYTDCEFKQLIGLVKDLSKILNDIGLDDVLAYNENNYKIDNN